MGEELSFGSHGGIAVLHHFPMDADNVIKVNIDMPFAEAGSGGRDMFRRSDSPEQLNVRIDSARVGVINIGKPKSSEGLESCVFFHLGPADTNDVNNVYVSRTLGEVRFPVRAGTRLIAYPSISER